MLRFSFCLFIAAVACIPKTHHGAHHYKPSVFPHVPAPSIYLPTPPPQHQPIYPGIHNPFIGYNPYYPQPAFFQDPNSLQQSLTQFFHNLFNGIPEINVNINIIQKSEETTATTELEKTTVQASEANTECIERPEIQPRNITFAHLRGLRLTVTWSDCVENYADLMDKDDCIYKGVVEGDPESSVLVTGCEDENINVQIHSSVFGDWLFPTKDGHALAIENDDNYNYYYGEEDYVENPEFEAQFPVIPLSNQRI